MPRAECLSLVGCDWVSQFLQSRGIGHARLAIDAEPDGGVVFLPATAVSTASSAEDVVGRYGGRAQVVLCGAPTSDSWLSAPGLVPSTVFASLPRDPLCEPAGWLGTCTKLSTGRAFSMRPYMRADAEFRYFSLNHGRDRHAVIDSVSAVLREADLAGRSLASLVDALEELLIRALSATAAATGIDATDLDAVDLPRRREIRVTVGVDGDTIGVGACDLYSHAITTRPTIVGAVRSVFEAQRIEGSTDIALVKAAKAASHFVVNVAAGVCEVICLVPRPGDAGRGARVRAPRSFGVFIR